jgi:Crinkler effector protein N-terminal domain
MSATLTLLCYILGDDPHKIFSIDIAPTRSVSHLQKAIKEEKNITLKNVKPDALYLWKTSITVESNFKEDIANLKTQLSKDDSLSPVKLLSTVFPAIIDEHVHVIIECSSAIGEFFLVLPNFIGILSDFSDGNVVTVPTTDLGSKKRVLEVEHTIAKCQKFSEGEEQICLTPHLLISAESSSRP